MGRALALAAFRLGADVTVVHRDTFPCVTNVPADTAGEMRAAVHRIFSEGWGADIYVSAAAISDFAPERRKGKIPSGKKTSLSLGPLPKLLDEVVRDYAPFTIAFKLGDAPEKRAEQMLQNGVSMVLMNPPETMGSRDGDYTLLSAEGRVRMTGTKEAVACRLWKEIVERG
jgi:phosphopantothenoylcysteine decarboxylase/phosphopantothenate--cysteine ligase